MGLSLKPRPIRAGDMGKPQDLPYGPYLLRGEDICRNVSGQLPGTYALGFTSDDCDFAVCYVGRSGQDVRRKLQLHTPELHPEFVFTYCRSEVEAFERECALFHELHPRDNIVHPAAPHGARVKCPVCGSRG